MKVIPKLQQGNTIESDNTKVVRPEIHEPIKAKPKQYSIVDLGGEPSNDTRSAAKRTNGNASVSLQDIKTMPADYTGSSILGGGNLEGRNLLAKYIFDENPVVKRMFFNKATSNIKPISRNEARRGFSHGDRYEQLYPGVHNRRYEMSAVVPSGRPLKFENVTKFTDYAGKNPIGKVVGKETEPVMRMGDKEFMTFRQPGTDYIGPIDDVAGHLVKFQMNKGKLRQTSQDMWKFNPADYAKRWNDSPNTANQVRLTKQAALMDKVGRPFILQQSNPIWIEGKSVRNPELVTMAHGGRFDFKKSPLLKKQEEINGKRDMRKKFIKSSRPTYKKRIKKAQQGMKFVSYNPVSNPTIDYTDITNPINPFSEYNFNTVYDKPEALVVPVRDTNEPDVVADKPVTKTANSTWKSPYTNRKQWSTELINAYKKAGITNDNAIRMLLAQDALESSWGKSAQGKYNFGNLTTGSSWKGDYVTGNDKNAKGEAIKQKFRSYNSMDEYAADKVQFLKRLYDFDENDDINKFVAKLTGSNKGKRRYAEATNYAKVLTGVYNGIPKGENGMIIKYQNPAQPIKYMGGYDKRGNIVLPVNNENGMNNVTLPEVTVTPRNINLAGAVDRGRREAAPYVSTLLTGAIFGPLSVAGGYAGNEAVNKITNVASNDKYKDWADMLSKTTGMNPVVADFFNIGNLAGGFGMRNFGPKLKPVKDMAVGGNKWARARVISKAIDKGTPSVEPLPNNVGWGPRQSIHVVHDKNSARLPKLYFPERWDAIHEGAPEVGIWYQGKFGNPRTAANHSIPGKAEKAAKARERFAKRPYRVEGDLELERPIVTVGDVPNRAALERAADKMSADGVIFNNVYDNGYSNNQVIFSLRDDLKNGRVFKKGAKPKVDAYYPSKVYKRTVDDVNRDYLNFIEYIDNSETMQKLADIDKELGTQYVKAVTDFKEAAKQGKLRVKSPKPGTLDIQGYPIRNPQTLTHPDIMKNPSYDYIDIDILADFPPNSVGHEFKHAIENYQAALSGIKGSVDDALFANPRLQALMKDNIVSEDEFVASMVKRYPKNDIKEIRKVYKYLTDPGEFNAQLHPLIELEQRAGKSGLPNFKDADAVNQVIKQGRASGHGGSHLDILFNNLLKPDKREEFVKQFNKYGWSLAAPAIINNRE
jgi:flagellum-specific peptidoglycan hydrolase FlgJ